MSDTKVITYAVAIEAINEALTQFEKNYPVDEEVMNVVRIAVNNDLQPRDYLMGITTEGRFTKDVVTRFVRYAIRNTQEESHKIHLLLVLATYLYGEDTEGAYEALNASRTIKETSLAILLGRVFGSGWPSQAFEAMRHELHPKVVQGMKDDSTFEIPAN